MWSYTIVKVLQKHENKMIIKTSFWISKYSVSQKLTEIITMIGLLRKTWCGCTNVGRFLDQPGEDRRGRQIQQNRPGRVDTYKTKSYLLSFHHVIYNTCIHSICQIITINLQNVLIKLKYCALSILKYIQHISIFNTLRSHVTSQLCNRSR